MLCLQKCPPLKVEAARPLGQVVLGDLLERSPLDYGRPHLCWGPRPWWWVVQHPQKIVELVELPAGRLHPWSAIHSCWGPDLRGNFQCLYFAIFIRSVKVWYHLVCNKRCIKGWKTVGSLKKNHNKSVYYFKPLKNHTYSKNWMIFVRSKHDFARSGWIMPPWNIFLCMA